MSSPVRPASDEEIEAWERSARRQRILASFRVELIIARLRAEEARADRAEAALREARTADLFLADRLAGATGERHGTGEAPGRRRRPHARRRTIPWGLIGTSKMPPLRHQIARPPTAAKRSTCGAP